MEFNSEYLRQNKKAVMSEIEKSYPFTDMGFIEHIIDSCILLEDSVFAYNTAKCKIYEPGMNRGAITIESKIIASRDSVMLAKVLRESTMYDMYPKTNGDSVLQLTYLEGER